MLQTMRRSHHDSLHDYGILNQEYGGARFMANLGDTRYNPTIRTLFPNHAGTWRMKRVKAKVGNAHETGGVTTLTKFT